MCVCLSACWSPSLAFLSPTCVCFCYCLCLYLYLNPSALQKALEQQPDASEVARKMAQLQLAAGDARGNHRCCGFEWGLDCHLPHLAWLVGSYSGRWQ